MIIAHLDFSGTYNEDMNYQENLLPRANVMHGHTVYFITTCYRWSNGVEVKTDAGSFELLDGIKLIRLPYTGIMNEYFKKKIRAVNGLYDILESISPDIIFLHCIQTFAVYSIRKYLYSHPSVILYADTHTDFHNSACSFFSRNILHKLIYKKFSHDIEPYIRILFYISYECKEFMQVMYGFPINKMKYMPLGGFLFSDYEYNRNRQNIRSEYNISESDIVFIHSGKISKQKRTKELVACFHQTSKMHLKLIIAGSIDTPTREQIMPIIEKDSRIYYIGWLEGKDLEKLLCAGDIYIQPGSQSATMETAACCRCALALYPFESHLHLWNDTVFYIKDAEDMRKLFLSVDINQVQKIRSAVYEIAKANLDYLEIAKYMEI